MSLDTALSHLATLGPIGRRLPAPGTMGTLAAIPFAWFVWGPMEAWSTDLAWATIPLGFALAVWACGRAEVVLGKEDPGEVILDEFAAFPLVFVAVPEMVSGPGAWWWLLLGFALFRFFDILKPLGIKHLQKLPCGWGVTVDDYVAALFAAVPQSLIYWWWASRG